MSIYCCFWVSCFWSKHYFGLNINLYLFLTVLYYQMNSASYTFLVINPWHERSPSLRARNSTYSCSGPLWSSVATLIIEVFMLVISTWVGVPGTKVIYLLPLDTIWWSSFCSLRTSSLTLIICSETVPGNALGTKSIACFSYFSICLSIWALCCISWFITWMLFDYVEHGLIDFFPISE